MLPDVVGHQYHFVLCYVTLLHYSITIILYCYVQKRRMQNVMFLKVGYLML